MAEGPLSTPRRALLGAAAALPVVALTKPVIASEAKQSSANSPAPLDCRASLAMTWNRRLARYRRLHARARQAAETGPLHQANRRYERDRAVLKARFGSWEEALETQEGRALGRAAFARVTRAEEIYYDRFTAPMMRSAILLATTPAPDLAALLAKIRVMQAHEMQELDTLPKPAFELLAEDVRRLAE